MKKNTILSLILGLVLVAPTVFSQTPQTSPTPPIVNDDEIVKVSTSLVQLDVVVTDRKGNQVTDLTPEDFEIYVNGKKQDISNFSYIFSKTNESVETVKLTKKERKKLKYSVPPPPSKLKLEKIRRTYAIVVDDLGLSFASMRNVKLSLKKFINEQMAEGDLVAILRTGSGMGAMQSFTTDKRQLIAAANAIRWNPQGRGGIGFYDPVRNTLNEDLASVGKTPPTVEGKDVKAEFENEISEFRSENFSVGSLGGLNYVIRGMRELPGRKAVIFFSEGFPLIVDEKSTRIFDLLKRLADVANRSSVVIYTLDPRGLQAPGGAGAEDNLTIRNPAGEIGARTVTSQLELRRESFIDSQQSLRYLAYQTGGKPYVNRNNLENGMKEAVEDQSGYYLIGYEPDEETFDPKKAKFNKVAIKLKRQRLKVRYRSGFFGIPDSEIKPNENKTPGQQIFGALSSPFGANDISLSLNTLFAEDEKDKLYIRSLVSIDANNLKFTKDSEQIYKANFDIVAVTFGNSGKIIDETSKNYTIKLGKKSYQKALEKGFIYNLIVPIKKPGAYQFRVAIRDAATAKVGSASQFIEVPNLKKNRLAISSIILDNYSVGQLKKISNKDDNYEYDTAMRRFKRGTVLRYDYIIYNAKKNPLDLEVQAKLFREGELFLKGMPKAFDEKGQKDLERMEAVGLITLGKNLAPGNYVLQIIATDKRSRRKYQNASRWIDFEIVE